MAGLLDGLLALLGSGFTSEKLPDPPPDLPSPRTGRPSRFRALFARESLPLDPERRRAHRNWLAFLFAPERLDPPGGTGPEVH